jgi:hypothetical protein
MTHPLFCRSILAAVLAGIALPSHAQTCEAHSTALPASVIELYTSEGCSSCPPADRWLSQVKADPQTIALAFHVDYWDRLGWVDRFASPVYTRRQAQQQAVNGARFSYTPQVVIDGQDRKDWPSAASRSASSSRPAAKVRIDLLREGNTVTATVQPTGTATQRLAAYWAVTEDRHASAVKAGENQGSTLQHDHVVRAYQPVSAWAAQPGIVTRLQFTAAPTTDTAHPRQVNIVVVDADSGRPLHALKLGC